LIVLSYMAYHKRQPVIWHFLMYNIEKKWRVQNMNYNVDIADEILDKLKADIVDKLSKGIVTVNNK
jgi:hypothetical protein